MSFFILYFHLFLFFFLSYAENTKFDQFGSLDKMRSLIVLPNYIDSSKKGTLDKGKSCRAIDVENLCFLEVTRWKKYFNFFSLLLFRSRLIYCTYFFILKKNLGHNAATLSHSCYFNSSLSRLEGYFFPSLSVFLSFSLKSHPKSSLLHYFPPSLSVLEFCEVLHRFSVLWCFSPLLEHKSVLR